MAADEDLAPRASIFKFRVYLHNSVKVNGGLVIYLDPK